MSNTPNLETIVSLCKRRGFIFPGSEVYGGLSGTWDYGPLGLQLKKNIMNLWWKMFVDDREDMFGVDAAILMNPKVWQASGHTETFTDPLVECSECKSRFHVDKIIEDKDRYYHFIDYVTYKFIERHQPSALEEPETKALKEKLDVTSLGKDEERFFTEIEKLPEWNDLTDFRQLILKGRDSKGYLGETAKTFLETIGVKCPVCGHVNWLAPRKFNMMFETKIGPTADALRIKVPVETVKKYLDSAKDEFVSFDMGRMKDHPLAPSTVFLRPETAQGIFTNYRNVVDSFYPDVPFGIAQVGKAFRNEISPRDFIFRDRELEQMEIEYFVHVNEWKEEFEKWIASIETFLKELGLPDDKIHKLEVEEADRAHYSKRTIDFEFDFPIGREELLGLAYRTDFDLQNIQKASGKNMDYRPKDGSEAFVPHVIEPSFGVERTIMAVLTSAYTEDEVNGEKRAFLKLPAHLAPVKVAVSPLLKNKPELVAKAREVYSMLKAEFGAVMWDDNGNIGKRYRRQDEIGTPYCVVIDFETLEGDTVDTVTIRNRDTTQQHRVKISELSNYVQSN